MNVEHGLAMGLLVLGGQEIGVALEVSLYWELGQMILEKQRQFSWGEKIIERISKDLKEEFPSMEGLSPSNLKYCKRIFLFYYSEIGQQAVHQLPEIPLHKAP